MKKRTITTDSQGIRILAAALLFFIKNGSLSKEMIGFLEELKDKGYVLVKEEEL